MISDKDYFPLQLHFVVAMTKLKIPEIILS